LIDRIRVPIHLP